MPLGVEFENSQDDYPRYERWVEPEDLTEMEFSNFEYHCNQLEVMMVKYKDNDSAKLQLYQRFNNLKTKFWKIYFQM